MPSARRSPVHLSSTSPVSKGNRVNVGMANSWRPESDFGDRGDRRSARTSHPCRRGAATADVPARPPSGTSGQARVLELHIGAICEHRLHHSGGLGQHRRAGRVDDHAAGSGRGARCRAGGAGAGPAPRDPGCTPPTRLGPAAQCAQPGAGCVDQYPVEGAVSPGRARAVAGHDAAQAGPDGARAAGDELGSVLLGSLASTWAPRWAASAANRAAFPPGPEQTSSQRSSRPPGRLGQRDGDELRTLVLHAGPALRHRGDGRGRRRPAPRRTAKARPAPPGRALAASTVRAAPRASPSVRRCRRPAARAARPPCPARRGVPRRPSAGARRRSTRGRPGPAPDPVPREPASHRGRRR